MMKEALKENYLKCWKFMNECRWFFVFAFGLFLLMFLIGFAFPVFFREEIFTLIEMLVLELEGKSILDLVGFIFLNNLKAGFMAMVLGIFFGIFPLVACVVNGYLLGFVAREAVMVDGIFVMWKILPHGIFELPAIIFAIGIGLKVGLSVFNERVRYNFREGMRFFVFVVFPLLVVAGIIEGLLIGMLG
jgi:stage II sporulation protein M